LDPNSILDKYSNIIFEIQTPTYGYFLYSLIYIDFVPKDEKYKYDQLYLTFESIDVKNFELLIEINLGVDVLVVFEETVNKFKKTIRVASSEPEFEFSEESCKVLKSLLDDLIYSLPDNVDEASIDSVKSLEPHYFNNIRLFD
jgi:hypothetical protein